MHSPLHVYDDDATFMIVSSWGDFIGDCCTLNSLNFPCFSETVVNGAMCSFSTTTAILLGFMKRPVQKGKGKRDF